MAHPRPPAAAPADPFLAVLPVIERHARRAFRHLRPGDREEATAEAVALAYRAFLRLRGRGQDPVAFPVALARFSALAVRNGRRAGSPAAARDVTSVRRRRAGTRVVSYSATGAADDPSVADALAVGTGHRVPDAAAFRVDFPAWVGRLDPARRRVALLLAAGHGTGAAAARAGVTAGRVSQVRRELAADWARFHAGRGGDAT